MKKIIIILCLLLISCSTKQLKKSDTIEYELSQQEKKIITDFISEEFAKKRYENYKDYKIYLRKKGFFETAPLIIYGYCYQEKNNRFRTANNKNWILDSLQLKNIKDTLKIKKFTWKETDISNFKVSIVNSEDLSNSIKKEGDYFQFSGSLILTFSIPVIIDKNNAFISYNCLKGLAGFSTIDSFAVLLKKSKDGIWIIDSYYYDPNSSW